MLFAQSMFSSEVVFGFTFVLFLVLLAIDLWSAPSYTASDELNEAAGQPTSRSGGTSSKIAQNR